MKVKQLKNIIKDLDDDTEISIIDSEHNYVYDIVDTEITNIFDDTYLDLVINMEE